MTSARGPEHLGVDLVHDGRDAVGEGPLWHDGRVVWVDIPAGRVHLLEPRSGYKEVVEVDHLVGAVAPRASGGFVAAVESGFAFIDPDTGRFELIVEVEADVPDNRMNDGKCDPRGNFWAGTMAMDDRRNEAALYRLDSARSVAKMVERVTLSNGLAWSPGGELMYYIDSATYAIDVFDFDVESGSLADRRRAIEIPRASGMPDGLTVDAGGYLWVALWGGSAVRRYAPSGDLAAVVDLPVSQVTSCAFGGPDLADLYITSASKGLSEEDLRNQPQAGGLFRCRPGVAGLPVHEFAG